jgi:tetratricopeptide (TPR) repeat protein
MSFPRLFITCVLLLACPVAVFAQLSNAADSLLKILNVHHQRDTLRATVLNKLAYEFYLSNPEKAIEYAYEAILLAQELKYPSAQAQGLRQLGLVSWAQSNYAIALKNFVAGLKIAEQINDPQIVADITGNIGLVYQGLGNYTEALIYHERSLGMQRKLKNKIRESVALNNLGDANRGLGNYDKAIEFYTMATRLREKDRNFNGLATNLRNIGTIMEAKQMYNEALEYYWKSLRMADSIPDKRAMSQIRQSLASIFFKMKRYTQARQFAIEGLRVSREANYRAYIRDAYLLLSQIAEAQKDIPSSFDFFKQYSQYKDSVVNLQIASEIASYRLDYETEKKQAEIDILKKDSLLQQSLLMQKNTLLILVGVTMALLSVLTAVLFKNYGRQKAANETLQTKNKEIEEQHKEITHQRDELMALNEEIRAQQEDIITSRDALEEKNISIAQMNESILNINENLEKIISERTAALEKQNHKLIEYTFINAHKLRAPLARIMGLANLVQYTPQDEEQAKLTALLLEAAHELDGVTKSINQVLEEGLDAYEQRHKSS